MSDLDDAGTICLSQWKLKSKRSAQGLNSRPSIAGKAPEPCDLTILPFRAPLVVLSCSFEPRPRYAIPSTPPFFHSIPVAPGRHVPTRP